MGGGQLMGDIGFANDLAEQDRQGAIAAITNRPRPTNRSAAICLECGDEIPAARQKAAPGCTRCIDCQREADSPR